MNLQPNQYNCIGILAKHCDLSKLCIAEKESSNFDLSELFCDFWLDIEAIKVEIDAYLANPTLPIPENYQEKTDLLNGGTFTDCDGKNRPFDGVYAILAYYSYSRYIVLNGFNDTANGMVTKTNDFSIPKPLKELEQFSNKYRDMGKIAFNRTVNFLCKNKTIFNYDCFINFGCGCGAKSCGSTKAKGRGFGFSNITK